MRLLNFVFTGSILLYGLLTTFFLLLSVLIGEVFWPIALYNTLAHLIWLICLPLLVICIALRRKYLSAVLLLPVLALVHFYSWAILPGNQNTPYFDDSPELTVMTYNLYWHNTNKIDYTKSIAVMQEFDADIIALQELSEEATSLIKTTLADEYPHMALYPESYGKLGAGILSRYPITAAEAYFSESTFRQQRAEIDFNNQTLVIYNVHLLHPPLDGTGFDTHKRVLQVTDILQRTDTETDPVILLGDFNMSDMSADYFRLLDVFEDTYRTAGTGFGWTHFITMWGYDLPCWMRLDYIFTRGSGFHVLESWVSEDSGGSDHSPVITKLEIYDPTLTIPQ